jgi:hypothetical protein
MPALASPGAGTLTIEALAFGKRAAAARTAAAALEEPS